MYATGCASGVTLKRTLDDKWRYRTSGIVDWRIFHPGGLLLRKRRFSTAVRRVSTRCASELQADY